MKDITDDTYYKIDIEEFAYSPYAPVSEERIKLEKKYWKSKSPQKYYEFMRNGILETIKTFGIMYEMITPEILNGIRYSIFAHPFDDGATCKNLRVFYNVNKQQIQIDWKFDGNSYEVYV
jgi:hypothetical protein